MIPRYADPRIEELFSDRAKLLRWQKVELAVIQARAEMRLIPISTYEGIRDALATNEPDVEWWKQEDEHLSHDLNAFINERRRFIPTELQHEFHRDMTSYDTEEAAFSLSLTAAAEIVELELGAFMAGLSQLAQRHRYTIMLDRTHGQWAKLRSFGSRVLTWRQELLVPSEMFKETMEYCEYSRISGAVGNYGGNMTPELERYALSILDREPFYGATQILPRTVYAPLAQALLLICEGVNKVALDIRLGARSGTTIYQEPFRKAQMGSSAMPHKKNTITTEQMEGLVRLAQSYTLAITSNCQTWESRAIEQSSVERVAWPDLFHVTLRMLKQMTRIVCGLVVYPDRMLEEVRASHGTYASDEAKNFLADVLGARGIPAETVYRIMQLACFNAFAPSQDALSWRERPAVDMKEATKRFRMAMAPQTEQKQLRNIQDILQFGELVVSPELEATSEQIAEWNQLLGETLRPHGEAWQDLFDPAYLLRGEETLFQKLILG